MKVIPAHTGNTSYSSGARVCGAWGCKFTTREGKPHCPEHVQLNPHASRVLQDIAQRAAEDALVAKGDTPAEGCNIRGLTAQAILQKLDEHGTRTRARICRDLSLAREVLDGYATALVKRGLIVEGKTQRGSVTLSLHRP